MWWQSPFASALRLPGQNNSAETKIESFSHGFPRSGGIFTLRTGAMIWRSSQANRSQLTSFLLPLSLSFLVVLLLCACSTDRTHSPLLPLHLAAHTHNTCIGPSSLFLSFLFLIFLCFFHLSQYTFSSRITISL